MNKPPNKIFPLGTNEVALSPWYDYLDYIFGATPYKMYAVTVTLIPSEWEELKQHPDDVQMEYINFKMSKYYRSYIFISELTKKKVLHFHGIVEDLDQNIESNSICYKKWKNKKTEIHYEDQRMNNQNYIKKIFSRRQLGAWINYMRKNMQPHEILDYFYSEQ